MILTITNTSDSDYSANNVTLNAGRTMLISSDNIYDLQFDNDTKRLLYIGVKESYWNPFVSGNAGEVPQFNLNGSAAERLYAAVVDDISAIITDTTDHFSNR